MEGLFPRISDNTNRDTNTKKRILAISTAAPAIPPKPKMAASMAITKKEMLQRNMKSPNYFKRAITKPTTKTTPEMITGVILPVLTATSAPNASKDSEFWKY